MKRQFHILLVFGTICIPLLNAQNFYQSESIEHFNRGEYSEAIQALRSWIETQESDRAIGNYYLGESYYNRAFQRQRIEEIRNDFQEAINYFEAALRSGIGDKYPGMERSCVYKLGWCWFRLSEIGLPSFDRAVNYFGQSLGEPPDSLSLFLRFLEAESRVRRVIDAFWRQILNPTPDQWTTSQNDLETSRQAFQRLLTYPLSSRLVFSVRLRLLDIDYLSGCWELARDRSVLFDHPERRREEAIRLFQRTNYQSMITPLNRRERQHISQDIYYLEADRYLKLYLLRQNEEDRQSLNRLLDSLSTRTRIYPAEIEWIRGCRDFLGILSDNTGTLLSQLADLEQSPFSRASTFSPEYRYWLGWIQRFYRHTERALESFNLFLERTQRLDDPRLVYMRDDATYQKIHIRFDLYGDQPQRIRELDGEIRRFNPISDEIRRKTVLLRWLIAVRLYPSPPDIWKALQKEFPNEEERLNMCIRLIQETLSRARQVTGRVRESYLRSLEGLFQITEGRRPEETRFYRGMSLFSTAEIQERRDQKKAFYLQAAEILQQVGETYRREAEYIRGRSLYAAAQFEDDPQRRARYYEQARTLLSDLIRSHHSLRALFYLAQIYYDQRNDRAAIECYNQIIRRTEGHPEGGYWYRNAIAGKALCDPNRGDEHVLDGLSIADIVFPDRLLLMGGKWISLESYTDQKFAEQELWDEVKRKMVLLGHLRREPYPAEEAPPGSRFYERRLFHIGAGIREKVESIYSALSLRVFLPQGVRENLSVSLNQRAIGKGPDGTFKQRPISLNSRLELRVENPGCYPYIGTIHFLTPGVQEKQIALMPFFEFVRDPSRAVEMVRFQDREDGLLLLLQRGREIPINSELFTDLNREITLRDFAYSNFHRKYFVTDASAVSVWTYEEPTLSRGGLFPLTYQEGIVPLVSPEGIAVDASGRLYIVDWKTHRILVAASDGTVTLAFGGPGQNIPDDVGRPVKFLFPTDVAIAEDSQGIQRDGNLIFRDPILWVSDRLGVHMVSSTGIYLGSLSVNPKIASEVYSLLCSGFAEKMKVYLADRGRGEILCFRAERK